VFKAGWSWGCVSAVDSKGRTIWIADAHRDDGKRFVVRADEKLTAFVELGGALDAQQGEKLASRSLLERFVDALSEIIFYLRLSSESGRPRS
jgi:hypothetical protein